MVVYFHRKVVFIAINCYQSIFTVDVKPTNLRGFQAEFGGLPVNLSWFLVTLDRIGLL